MLSERISSPLNFNFFAIQEPVEPVTCTSGASGPRLPPEEMQSSEDKYIDGLYFGANLPPLKRMLLTKSRISPGSPIKWIINPAANPASPINGITYKPWKAAKLWVRCSRTIQ